MRIMARIPLDKALRMSPLSFLTKIAGLLALLLVSSPRKTEAQLNSQEQQFLSIMTNASAQGRPFIQMDPILSRVARARATDMARRGYFAHTNPDGHGPNYLVRQAGYILPAHYDQSASGNNIESCSAGDSGASAAWNYLLESAPHKKHLLAESSFYAEQTSVGVGYCYDAGSDYKHYWVILSAPPAGPTLTITSPAANAGITATQATVSGTSGGAPVAARIVFKLENSNGLGTFANANGVANWSATLTDLAPGVNTVRIRSLNAAGGLIKELTRSFRHVVPSPLSVELAGNGSVTAGFAGVTQKELGRVYTVTAKPAVGWLFDHWSGSINSTAAALTFTMQEGFTLIAHFRENPFYASKGVYGGLIVSPLPTHASSGFLKVSTTVTGAFSGQLTLGGKVHALRGKFDAEGNAEVRILRGVLPPLTVSLQLDLAGATSQISGTVSDGASVGTISADRSAPAGSEHFAAGRYTFVIPAASLLRAEVPQGDGSGVLVVSSAGVAKLTGTLADGRSFTRTTNLSSGGKLPLYVPLLAGSGSLVGNATFSSDSGALNGSLHWSKAERPADRFYPAAFQVQLSLVGARYVPPTVGNTVIEVPATDGNTSLQLEQGDLEFVEQVTTLAPNNVVTVQEPILPKLVLRMTPGTGRFTGSFTHPETNTASRISGVILQNVNLGFGFFLGANQSGAASFGPIGQ